MIQNYNFMTPRQQIGKVNTSRSAPKQKQQKQHQNNTSSQRAKSILAQAEQKLLHDLNTQSITIPVKSKPFLLPSERIKQSQQSQKIMLQKLVQEKQEIRKKLIQMEKSQRLIKAGLTTPGNRDRNHLSVRPRSQLSTFDIDKLKKLKRQQANFEKQLQQKTKAFQENQLKHKAEEQQLMQNKMKQTNQKKKQQIAKRLQQLKHRQSSRAKKFEQDKRKYLEAKMGKRLHQQLEQKWAKIQEHQQQNKRKQYEQRKRQKSIDLTELKQHEKRYEDILRKNKQQLTKKRIEASRVGHKLFKNKIHQSKFYTLILQQEQQKKKQKADKKQIIVNLIERRKQFAQIVKQNHAPKIKMKSEQDQDQKKQQSKRVCLQPQQMRKKGQSYLEQSKSKAMKSKSKKDKSFDISQISDVTEQVPKYHDYLTQIRRTRNQNDERSLKMERNFDNDVREAKNIMKRTSFTDMEKIQRVKVLAQRMETDLKSTKSSTLLKKIQAKMQILEALQ